MLNHITIMGRLTRDPELRRTGSGIAVASFTVAVDRDFGGRDGGERETDFIDCVAFTSEIVSNSFPLIKSVFTNIIFFTFLYFDQSFYAYINHKSGKCKWNNT